MTTDTAQLAAQCLGRARFCRDRGEIKTPELLEYAADELDRLRAAEAKLSAQLLECLKQMNALQAELARTQLERDEARSQFDNHVVWASDSVAKLQADLSEERHAHNKTQFDLAEARKERALIVAIVKQIERGEHMKGGSDGDL